MTQQNPDAMMLALIDRHTALWDEWGGLMRQDENDPRLGGLSDECDKLEHRIIAMPAHTAAGLAGKVALITNVDFTDSCGADIDMLVDAILEVDEARIAAA
jgi:hypothetical protein